MPITRVLALLSLALPSLSQVAWTDSFAHYNASLWVLSTDIEHCSDGACFLARPDHATFGKEGLTINLNQVRGGKEELPTRAEEGGYQGGSAYLL